MGKSQKKHWSDMSRGQRVATIAGATVQVTLLAPPCGTSPTVPPPGSRAASGPGPRPRS